MEKKFDYAVIYKGVLYPAGTPIKVEEPKVEEPKAEKTVKKAVKKNDTGTDK